MESSESSNALEMLRSIKGKDMLLADGFLYHYSDRNAKAYRWVCSRRKDKTPCRASIYTNLIEEWDVTRHKLERSVGDHSHEPASMHTIIRARDKKRHADNVGLPCTISNNTLKRQKCQMDAMNESPAKKPKTMDNDLFDDIIEQLEDSNHEESSAEETADKDVLMLKTAKGVHMIAIDGFVYRLDGKSMISCTYRWRCFRAKDLRCPGRIYTECLSNGQHRYKAFRAEENKHNHQFYTEEKIETLIKRNNISILRHHSAQTSFQEEKPAPSYKKTNSMRTVPLSVTKGGGNVLTICTDINVTPKFSTRTEKANATAALYRFVSDPMDTLDDARDKSGITKFSFLPSLKGNRVLLLKNTLYHYDSRGSRDDRAYWTCMYRRDKKWKCKSRLTTEKTGIDIRIIKVSDNHTHPTDHSSQIEKRLKMNISIKDDKLKLNQVQGIHFNIKNSPPQQTDNENNAESDDDDYFGDHEHQIEENAIDVISEFLQLKGKQNEIAEDIEETMMETDQQEDPFYDTIEYVNVDDIDSSIYNADYEQEPISVPIKVKNEPAGSASKALNRKSNVNKITANATKSEKVTDNDATDYDEDNELATSKRQASKLSKTLGNKLSASSKAFIKSETDKFNDDDDTDYEEFCMPSTSNKSKSKEAVKYSKKSSVSDNDNENEDGIKNVYAKPFKQQSRLNKISANTPNISSNPDNIDITKTSKLRSAKGGELLCVDGYIYHLKSISPTTRTYWACIKSKDRRLKCPARVTTFTYGDNQLKVVHLSNSHTHGVSENDIKKRLFNEYSKLSTTKSNLKSKDILGKPLKELNPEFAEMLLGKIGDVETRVDSM